MNALKSFCGIVAAILCLASGYVIKGYIESGDGAIFDHMNIAVYVIILSALALAVTVLCLILKLGKLSKRGIAVWESDADRSICKNCRAVLVDGAMFCHKCGTRIDNAANAPYHPKRGRKWFVLFTKVRPWGLLISAISSIAMLPDLVKFYDFTTLMVIGVLTFAQVFLSFVVSYKAKRDYSEFLDFLRIDLILEIFIGVISYLLIETYGYVVLEIIIGILWYNWNMNYFRKRNPANNNCCCNR